MYGRSTVVSVPVLMHDAFRLLKIAPAFRHISNGKHYLTIAASHQIYYTVLYFFDLGLSLP